MRLEVFTEKIAFFWDVAPCSIFDTLKLFGRSCWKKLLPPSSG
jgi:hypothetical protein